MAGLLLSVRNPSEAAIAVAAGASIVDIKEPDRGPLGRPSPRLVERVVAAVAGKAPVSVALGELTDWDRSEWADFPRGVAFAKFGLAGCARRSNWARHWHDVLMGLPVGVRPVAVIYADWLAAAAPPPSEVLEAASQNRCAAVLIDTFDKSRGPLLSWLTLQQLSQLADDIRRRQMLVVLGGSLAADTIPQVLPLRPDYVAVRRAACRGPRNGPLDDALARHLAALVTQEAAPHPVAIA